jgi:hypothetical protein
MRDNVLATLAEFLRAPRLSASPRRGVAQHGIAIVAALIVSSAPGFAQAPPIIDTSTIGPKVGERLPEFSGTDQRGRLQTLESAAGPDGTMLVFFRSADW